MDFLNAIILISNFIIVPAITYGSQLALGAIGVTLIYGVLRFANFAYGDLMAFGTMIVILFTWFLHQKELPLGYYLQLFWLYLLEYFSPLLSVYSSTKQFLSITEKRKAIP